MTNFQALILAAGIAFAGIAGAVAQRTTPDMVPGCIYNAGGITLTGTYQTTPLQCDINGHLKVTTSATP